MQARKTAAKESAGNQRRISGLVSGGFIDLASTRRGSEISVRNFSSKPAGGGVGGVLRSNCSIRSSFIISSFSSRPKFRLPGVGPQEIECLAQAVFHRAGGDAQRCRSLLQRQTLIIVQMDCFFGPVLQSVHQREQLMGCVALGGIFERAWPFRRARLPPLVGLGIHRRVCAPPIDINMMSNAV